MQQLLVFLQPLLSVQSVLLITVSKCPCVAVSTECPGMPFAPLHLVTSAVITPFGESRRANCHTVAGMAARQNVRQTILWLLVSL